MGTLFSYSSRALCVERMASDDLNESLSEVEAVMRLLEEKERDLELAARIGQTLLADNRKLKVKLGTHAHAATYIYADTHTHRQTDALTHAHVHAHTGPFI